jgi:predicted phosphodiesterase
MFFRIPSLFLVMIILPGIIHGQVKSSAKLTIAPVDGAVPYTHLDFNDSEDRFQFAIVTDRTGGHRPGVFMDGVNKLNLLQPEFVMSVGDLIEGYTKDTIELKRQWSEFDAFVHALEMPFFYVPGNHDITNQVMEKLWIERFGSTFYHFVYKDVLFLALNSEDLLRGAGRGSISDRQFEYIKKTLEYYEDVNWTLVFLHQPLWNQQDSKRWKEVEALLANRNHTVFAGHEHRYVKEDRNNGKYFTLATTGGVSSLRGTEFGEFDHVLWVSMTPEGPVMANLLLEGIWDEHVVSREKSDWIREITKANPFQIEPVVKKDPYFFIGGAKIKITNDRNIPMVVKFEEKNSEDLIGMLETREIILPPNDVREIRYTLRSRNDKIKEPFQLIANVSYVTVDENLAMEVPFKFNLKPVEYRVLKKLDHEIAIDGSFGDWKEFPYHFEEKMDFSASFNLGYDDEYIYMAMKVQDSDVNSIGSGVAWKQDNAGLGFSAEPMRKSAMNTGRRYYRDIFFVMITPEMENTKSVLSSKMPEGSLIKCKTTKDGYFAELAVPLNYVEEMQGKDWRSIRVGAAVDDLDDGQLLRHWWKPNWMDRDANYIGSGLFWRE